MAGTSRKHLSVPEETIRQSFEAWLRHDQSLMRAAAERGVSEKTIERHVRAYKKARWDAQQGNAPAYDITHAIPEGLTSRGPSILYDSAGNVQAYWNKMKAAGRDQKETTQLPDPKKIVRTAKLYDNQGKVTQEWVTEQADLAARETLWREFAAELGAELPRIDPAPMPVIAFSETLMNVIPFGDPHFGLHCWGEEVGEDFDLKIARRDLCGAVDYLVSQAPPAKRCVIINLGDLFHADNLDGRTAKSGHILDMDTRLPKIMRVGVAAMRQCIESALKRHEIVEVINAIGNHDEVLSQAIAILLANLYENEPRIIVHDMPTRRHYIRHGKVMIGVTHGDRTKDTALPGIMATERSVDWGLTKHRYFYRGHHHHDEKMEFNGCIVEQFRTLTPGDSYAVAGGWLAGRDMKLITHHAEYGEVARATCSIDLLRGLSV